MSDSNYINRQEAIDAVKDYFNGETATAFPPTDLESCEIGVLKELEFIPTAEVAEFIPCSECKHLKVVNENPIYAVCEKEKLTFLLWEADTRNHSCTNGEKKRRTPTLKEMSDMVGEAAKKAWDEYINSPPSNLRKMLELKEKRDEE